MSHAPKPDADKIIKTLAQASAFGLILGWAVASFYMTVHDGFAISKFDNVNFFALITESPLFAETFSDKFRNSLLILLGMTVTICFVSMAILFEQKSGVHGTARWATKQELVQKEYLKPYDKITTPIFGKWAKPESRGLYLTNGPHPHTLVAAPTRAGKGVGVVIPTMLTHDGSSIVLDVKGELYESTARARIARGDKIIKFSPLDMEGRTHRFNPIDDIVRVPPERRFVEARRLAVSLIVSKGKGGEGFIDGARDLFVAGVLACIERSTPTIGAVYDLFSQPGEKFKLFAQLAEDTKSKEAQQIFDNMAGNDQKILTSYTSVLGDGGLNLWADQLVKNATAASDFSIQDLRRDPTAVFIIVSPNDIEVLAPLVRLLFQQTVGILQRTLPEKDETFEVLFLLDEFKHLGKMEAIETAITTIAGYGGRFMFVIQTLSALTENYGQSGKENFLGNTGLQVFMATTDAETPEYISKAIGEYTRTSRSKSWNSFEYMKSNVQEREEGTKLIRPEQIRLLDERKQIILIKGEPPVMIDKVRFYKDRILKKLFDDQHGELPEPPSLLTKPDDGIAIPTAENPGEREAVSVDTQPAYNAEAPPEPQETQSSGSTTQQVPNPHELEIIQQQRQAEEQRRREAEAIEQQRQAELAAQAQQQRPSPQLELLKKIDFVQQQLSRQ